MSNKTTYIVYKHTNKINNKIYIGITKYGDNPNIRWRNGMGYTSNKKFFSDILKNTVGIILIMKYWSKI